MAQQCTNRQRTRWCDATVLCCTLHLSTPVQDYLVAREPVASTHAPYRTSIAWCCVRVFIKGLIGWLVACVGVRVGLCW
jgi:hypothetical protein